jgi:type IV fimbrial biogenesis protein FimT
MRMHTNKMYAKQPLMTTKIHLFRAYSNAGFTLTELLITISIAGILAMLAIPSFSDLTATQRAKNTSTDLYVALIRTRSEALKLNRSVNLLPKAGGWQNGWEIVNTGSGNIMEDHGPLKGVTVTTSSGPSTIAYNNYGRVQGGTTSLLITATGTATVSRCVKVDSSGRPYVMPSSC